MVAAAEAADRIHQVAAVADSRLKPPALGIDFGVTAEGRTVLVGVNGADSLGHIGLRPGVYANMLAARWLEPVDRRPLG